MKAAREAFGSRLRSERERLGISLDTIAQSTKIKRSLLVDLESDDLSRWPAGIFRRAFFREYLAAIGSSSEALVAEFSRRFPDGGATVADEAADELRLKLAPMPSSTGRRFAVQSAAALADVCVVALLAVATALVVPRYAWQGVTAILVGYYGLSAALLGRAPVAAWLARDRTAPRRRPAATAHVPTVEPALLRIVVRHSELPRERPIGVETSAEAPGQIPSTQPAHRHASSR